MRNARLTLFFDAYKPDIIFTPKITSTIDRSFLRQAKKRHLRTIGMISTWDNITLTKYPFRILPDKLIAYNEIIKKEAIKYLGLSSKSICLTGMPHYDFYVTNKRATREEFCARLNINPKRRIILFASVGKIANPTEWQTLSLLVQDIKDKKLPDDVIIIFRQHPTEKAEIGNIPQNDYVIIDDSKTVFSTGTGAFSEILSRDMEHLADSLYHTALVVTTTSSMSVDASVFDTPIINLAFDGWEQLPFYLSVRRKLTKHHTHYQPIVKKGGVRIAYSHAELVLSINQYLENPSLDREGRKRIVQEQCYRLDGRAGKRIGEYLLSQLQTASNTK